MQTFPKMPDKNPDSAIGSALCAAAQPERENNSAFRLETV
jgi:hypothetical protein